MKEKIRQLSEELDRLMAESHDELEQMRIRFLSKKGLIPSLFADFKQTETSHYQYARRSVRHLTS